MAPIGLVEYLNIPTLPEETVKNVMQLEKVSLPYFGKHLVVCWADGWDNFEP